MNFDLKASSSGNLPALGGAGQAVIHVWELHKSGELCSDLPGEGYHPGMT